MAATRLEWNIERRESAREVLDDLRYELQRAEERVAIQLRVVQAWNDAVLEEELWRRKLEANL